MSQVTGVDSLCEDRVTKSNTTAGVVVRGAAVLVAVSSAAVHVLALPGGAAASPLAVLVLLGMAAACLPCAVHLALLPRRRTWVQAVVVWAAVLVAHALLPAHLGVGHHGPGHDGGGAVGMAMVAVPALGLALALVGLGVTRPVPRGVV